MTLNELLTQNRIRTALIIDDVYDATPTANDIVSSGEVWANFNDDLSSAQRQRIFEIYPAAANRSFAECINDDEYVSAVWSLRLELGEVADDLFNIYIRDQEADTRYVELVKEQLESHGLEVSTAGVNGSDNTPLTDIVIIDLFLGKNQEDTSFEISKSKLRRLLSNKGTANPIVILMSRSSRLEFKRDEFRNEVGLLDSSFRILKKEELDNPERLPQLLQRLAENFADSNALAKLFFRLEEGIRGGTERTLRLLRNLKLSDIGQIQQILLSAEGQPVGSYLVDVFDKVLQHEIERDEGIIQAALDLNNFSYANYPPPFVAGSADLQELVQRILTQNEVRLKLPGSVENFVTFGDVFRIAPGVDSKKVQRDILVELGAENVILVLTPACDLQRCTAPRILLLVGKIKPIAIKDWQSGDDARTSAIRIDNRLFWVKWDLKHIDTISTSQLKNALDINEIEHIGRLREGHTLELQQKVLSGLGRVGQLATLPGTFAVELEVYYPDTQDNLVRLNLPELSDGAVCFVGREGKRLVMTEVSSDAVQLAIKQLDESYVSSKALTAFRHVKSSFDLRNLMIRGFNLQGVGSENWKEINSETGGTAVQKMGYIAWDKVIKDKDSSLKMSKAGIVFVIRSIN